MNEEILKRVDALAVKLGVTAQHLWGVLIRQARVEAITDALWFVLALAGVPALIWGAVKCFRRSDESSCDEEVWVISGVVCVVACVVLAIIGIVALFSLPTELFNPEYFALDRLASLLKR